MTGATHHLILVRHGETTGESSIRYHGASDVPLSELGEEQMHRVGLSLKGTRFDNVFTSRLVRSRRAAEIIAPAGPEALVCPGFDEINFGRWEGLTREEIAERDPELFRKWQDDPAKFHFPQGENRMGFGARVVRAMDQILAQQAAGVWLVVVHRGVIASLLGSCLGIDVVKTLEIGLGSSHTLTRHYGTWRAERLDFVPPA